MIDEQKFFDQQIKNNIRAWDNILKISGDQGDAYTTGCCVFYPYFNECYKMMAIDLRKQQALDADPNAINQINFTGNLEEVGRTTVLIFIEVAKETILESLQGTVRLLQFYFALI